MNEQPTDAEEQRSDHPPMTDGTRVGRRDPETDEGADRTPDDMVDDSSEDSFPASDPPSYTRSTAD